MSIYPGGPINLEDSVIHGANSGAELFIVEGDSASGAVTALRNRKLQAVLPMLGKPMNALKANAIKVAEFPLYQALIDALGAGFGDSFDPKKMRYQRIILLFDPDADGIHCGALMQIFFYRWMRPLVEAGAVESVRAPLFEITCGEKFQPVYAYSEDHCRTLCERLREKNFHDIRSQRYRGLAGINQPTLAATCIHPATRKTRVIGVEEAERASEALGGT
ncbi:MAG: toprim domain-containing protein [Burkholderiales bacterium]